MDIITKNIHLFIIIYALYGGYEYYEQQDGKLVGLKQTLEAGKAKVQRVKKELRQVEQYQKDLVASEQRVQEVVGKLEELTRQLPPTINDTEISTVLEKFSTKLKMFDLNFSPGKELEKGFYFAKDYNFDVKGTYLQFLIFYEKLEKLSENGRILNVKYLRMKKSDKGDKRSRFQILDLSTTLEAFRSNSKFDVRDIN